MHYLIFEISTHQSLTLGRSIDSQLVDGHGVDCGHEALHDAKVVVDHLDSKYQADTGRKWPVNTRARCTCATMSESLST